MMALLTAAATAEPSGMDQLLFQLILIGGLFVVFYFLFYRPQKKKDKELAELRKSLEVGDEVVTIGGIVGRVVSIKDDTVTIETGADKNKIRIKRWSIQEKASVKE